MEHAKLVLRCLLTVAGFGAIFGSVCALICPEVFTLGRPPSFGNLPAPVLGMVWGAIDFLIPGGSRTRIADKISEIIPMGTLIKKIHRHE